MHSQGGEIVKFEPGDVIVPVNSTTTVKGLSGVFSNSPTGTGCYVWGKRPAGWISPIEISTTISKYRLANPEERREILWAMVGVLFFRTEDSRKRKRWGEVIEHVVKPTIASHGR